MYDVAVLRRPLTKRQIGLNGFGPRQLTVTWRCFAAPPGPAVR